jgi:hypothetical protein
MVYNHQNRLNHASRRFAEVNTETVTYTRDGEAGIPIAASPILIPATELQVAASAFQNAGYGAVTRADLQLWGVEITALVTLDPATPQVGDLITRANGDIFRVVSRSDDDPAYDYVTSTRDRFLVHSIRISVS